MTPTPSLLRSFILLTALLLPLGASAQIAVGKDKFLGNIIAGSVPASFNTYWNQVTPENSSKWGSVEGTRNSMNWTQLDLAYNHAKANGYKFKLHTLVWGAQYPAWITGLSPTELRAEIEEWMTLLAARYPDVWAIDVVNEPIKTPLTGTIANYKAALGGDGTTGWDWVITSFQLARQKFPNAKLILNEYGTENDPPVRTSYKTILFLLKDRGLIDGIGLQAHYFNVDNMSSAGVTAMLDDYATMNLDIYITELDIRGSLQTEAAQLAQYQIVFPSLWTHPAVKGVTLWGYIVGQTWVANTGILNADGTERAALTWLKGYVTGTVTTAPTPPSRLAGTTLSSSSISLSWDDNANNETAYKMEIAPAATGPWTEIASLAADTRIYTATALNAATPYSFRVRASNGSVNSDYTNTVTLTTPSAIITPPPSPPSSGGGGGGGGAPSLWFLAFLSLAALGRLRAHRLRL